MIPSDTVEAIRSRLDIVELVSEHVPQLQRAGRNMKARCPFHQERTPSFVVSPERQTFHCFGCGEGGDAFTFLMKMENLSFTEAVEKLAQRTGVKIEAQELSGADKERLKLKELLGLAAEYYHKVLASAAGTPARAYLERRGVSAESIAEFKLGFAPKEGELLQKASAKGFPAQQLVKAGLAAERGGRTRDFFFDRVLYPILDAKGAVVAFGGRTLGDGAPKYLNSPESPVFSKSRLLYGLFQGLAAVRKERRVVLMEGYMDVIAAHQHGLPLACAPLGTALTPEHAALVKRYADEAVIVFDVDSAGLNAAVRGAELLLAEGLAVRIATVPEGKDPDELLLKGGLPVLEACLREAVDLVRFKTELNLKAVHGPLSPQRKSEIAKAALETIAKSPDEILKAEWLRWLSQRLGVEEEALRRQDAKTAPPIRALARPPAAPQEASLADLQILGLAALKPELAGLIQETDFASERAVRVWRALRALEARGEGREGWSARLLDGLEDEADRRLASRVLVESPEAADAKAALTEALARRRAHKRLEELKSQLAGGDAKLLDEYKRLTAELKGSKR